jgi:hypothetical protein
MSDDALDIAVARHVKQAGMATPGQLAGAMQAQAEAAAAGQPLPLVDALVRVGAVTAAQRDLVLRQVQEQKSGVQQLGGFRLLKKLGEGGMGAVYLAEDPRDGRRVALKVLPKRLSGEVEFVKRFRREAEAASRLSHPHIVRGFETGEDLGFHFYVMEYGEGETLEAALKREGPVPWERAVAIARQVALGLGHAHEKGIVHRDIKPGNIFLGRDGAARILDFGLAKDLGGTSLSFRTVSGAVLGTPHYISPEQAGGSKAVDGRSDLYSLGATLYHVLTGQTPFDGTTLLEILTKQIRAELPNPQDIREGIPDGVVHVLRKLMAKEPADRHPDAAALVADLEEVAKGRPPRSEVLGAERSSIALVRKPATRRATARRVVARRKSAAPAVLATAFVVAVFAVVLTVAITRTPGEKAGVKPPPVAQKPLPPPSPLPAPAVARAANAVDLLRLIDPARDAVRGRWKIDQGRLASDDTEFALLELPYDPPEEYDLRATFSRQKGRCSTALLLTLAGRAFAWTMSDVGNAWFAISTIGGRAVRDNPTSRREALVDGMTYTVLVEVRRTRVTAFVNGTMKAEWSPAMGDLACEADWKLRRPGRLGLGSCESLTTFESVEVVPAPPTPSKGSPVDAAWLRSVAVLPAPAQAARVVEKLKDLNPGYDGTQEHEIAEGAIVLLRIPTGRVSDLSPVAALKGLKVFDGAGNEVQRGILADLAPLRGLPLTGLYLGFNFTLRDLGPLRELKLQRLDLGGTAVSDLTALEEMPLRVLYLPGTKVASLEPLRKMRLQMLTLHSSLVRDLEPLRGQPIESLRCGNSQVADLRPVQSMPIRELWCDVVAERDAPILRPIRTLEKVNGVAVADLWKASDEPDAVWIASVARLPPDEQVRQVVARLKARNPEFDGVEQHEVEGGAVTGLTISAVGIRDLSPIRALVSLRMLLCSGEWNEVTKEFRRGTLEDLSPLRGTGLTKLRINATPVKDLRPLEGLPLKDLNCGGTEVGDLSPLRKMALSHLLCFQTKVRDLEPLRGMPMEWLNVAGTQVADLRPLEGMGLAGLECEDNDIEDLSPLRGATFSEILCDVRSDRHAEVLRSMPNLIKINGVPKAEFWKHHGDAAPWRTVTGAQGDGLIRFRFEAKGGEGIDFSVRDGPAGHYGVALDRKWIADLRGVAHALVFRCAGGEVAATLDGHRVEVVRTGAPGPRGIVQFKCRGEGLRVLTVEYKGLP